MAMELTEYKGHKLERGLWKDEYTRVFSLEGTGRVAEISNYPRVYRDTARHVYTEDTPFTVGKHDCNTIDGRYFDYINETLHNIGEEAIHHKGEPLPGAFPRWIEHETPQPITDIGRQVFGMTKVPKLKDAHAISLKNDTQLVDQDVKSFEAAVKGSEVVVAHSGAVKRRIMYIHYDREESPK